MSIAGYPIGSPLSLRERQVVELVQRAKSNKEIASELSLTVGSVKEYLHRIFRKLGVRNRTELALWKPNRAACHAADEPGNPLACQEPELQLEVA
jgi:DNA-binding NarL/FixJ family response regulator